MSDADPFLLGLSFALLVTLLVGLMPALRRPGLQDRILSVQLLGTGGVALLLLLAAVMKAPSLIDVALVLALLAAVAAVAVTRREVARD